MTNRSTTVLELVPLLFVEDIERSVSFYRDRLGFSMQMKWEPAGKLSWCRLARDGAAIMLQQACPDDERVAVAGAAAHGDQQSDQPGRGSLREPQAPTSAQPQKPQRGLGVGFFFICDDAAALQLELVGRGLDVDPPRPAFYGMNQLFLKDPDGYELCFESVIDEVKA